MKGYNITPKGSGIFEVINLENKEIYKVDIFEPNCSCKGYKYTKKNKAGNKSPCKHINICRGIKDEKAEQNDYGLFIQYDFINRFWTSL